MAKMKDSGVEWIGEIPEEWGISKIGCIYKLRNSKVSDYDYPPLSVTMQGILPQLETAAKSDAHDARKLVKDGDFVINSRSDRRGSCGIATRDGSVSLINHVLKPNKNIFPTYFFYLFRTEEFANEFYRWGHGIVADLWTTDWQSMRNILIPLPNFNQQQLIGNFLTRKCAQIDAILASIQQSIEKLKQYRQAVITRAVTKGLDPDARMKDSGVEWIGEIPEEWEVRRLKNISILNPAISITLAEDEEVSFLPMENIKNGNVSLQSVNIKDVADKSYNIFSNNDILVAKVTPCFENGNIAIAENVTNGVGFATTEIFVVRPYDCHVKFLFYFLQSQTFKERAISTMTGTGGLKRVSPQFMRDEKMAIPNCQVQQKIASHLDHKCAQIDALISEKQKLHDKFTTYKKSLIYEYVTGKAEVPDGLG